MLVHSIIFGSALDSVVVDQLNSGILVSIDSMWSDVGSGFFFSHSATGCLGVAFFFKRELVQLCDMEMLNKCTELR